jgi:hypothetical protein
VTGELDSQLSDMTSVHFSGSCNSVVSGVSRSFLGSVAFLELECNAFSGETLWLLPSLRAENTDYKQPILNYTLNPF